MYETVRLTEKVLDLFAHLDPYNMLDLGKRLDRVCLGTVRKGENGAKDTPVGLMVCRVIEDALVIEWVYVDGSSRYQCIGAELMRRAFEEARRMGLEKLYAYLVPIESRSEICSGERDFVSDYHMKLIRPSKESARLFRKLIPEEYIGSDLYCADVGDYFAKMAEKPAGM